MWSFRKEIHKISSIGKLGTPINCDTPLDVTGNSGIYLLLVELGTDTGLVNIDYNAVNIPDRFEIFWGDTVNPVADTKYVGNSLADYIDDLLNTFTLTEREYDGNRFINNGSTTTITNTNSDIADGSPQEPTSGSGTISFIKDSATPTQVLIKVTAPLGGTAWDATVFCPRPIPDQIAEGDCEDFNPSTANWEDIYLDVTPELLSIGDTIYTDPEKTNEFIGRARISYRVRTNPITGSSDLVDRVFSVNGDGEVTDLQECTVEDPSLIEISKVVGEETTQVFEVGENVSSGNIFSLTVYSYTVSVTATSTDTPISIATKLSQAINDTTESEWDTMGTAPIGAGNFPPTATSNNDQITVILNKGNSFSGTASIN